MLLRLLIECQYLSRVRPRAGDPSRTYLVQARMSSPVKSARGQPAPSRLVARAASGKLSRASLALALAVVAGMSGPLICGVFLSNWPAIIIVVSDRFLGDARLVAFICLLDAGNRVPPKGPGLSPPRPGPYFRAVLSDGSAEHER